MPLAFLLQFLTTKKEYKCLLNVHKDSRGSYFLSRLENFSDVQSNVFT